MDERGNSMTDSSPLRNIKTALNKLKKEIAEMDLRIGVVWLLPESFFSLPHQTRALSYF